MAALSWNASIFSGTRRATALPTPLGFCFSSFSCTPDFTAHTQNYIRTCTQSTFFFFFFFSFIWNRNMQKSGGGIWCSFLHQWLNALKFKALFGASLFLNGEDKAAALLFIRREGMKEARSHCFGQPRRGGGGKWVTGNKERRLWTLCRCVSVQNDGRLFVVVVVVVFAAFKRGMSVMIFVMQVRDSVSQSSSTRDV